MAETLSLLMRDSVEKRALSQEVVNDIIGNKPSNKNRQQKWLWEGIVQRTPLDSTQKFQIYDVLDVDDHIHNQSFYECGDKQQFEPLTDLVIAKDDQHEIILVQSDSDIDLCEFAESVRQQIEDEDQRQAFSTIAVMVSERMSSKEPSTDLQVLKELYQSNVLRIGLIQRGGSRHRALLFKYLCDALSTSNVMLRCRVIRTSKKDHSFNVVICDDGSQFVVDLMQDPGELLDDDSKEAEQYRRAQRYRRIPHDQPREYPFDIITEIKKDHLLGEGPMGTTYKITTYSLFCDREELAMKEIILPESSSATLATEKINQLRYLRHPNLVRMKQGWVDGKHMRIFTELCTTDAYNLIHNNSYRKEYSKEVLLIVLGAARAARFLASKGFVHDNIKSTNVLLNMYRGVITEVKLSDFEVNRLLLDQQSERRSGQYSSPEAYWGNYTAASMVYAIGVLIAECITRKAPASTPFDDEEVLKCAGEDTILFELAQLQSSCCQLENESRIDLEKLVDQLEILLLQNALDDVPPDPLSLEPVRVTAPELDITSSNGSTADDSQSDNNLRITSRHITPSPTDGEKKRTLLQKLKRVKNETITPKTDRFWAKHFSTKICKCSNCGFRALKGKFYGYLYDVTYCPHCHRPVDLSKH